MSTKKMYPLIGDKTERIDWVVTSNLRPDLDFPHNGQSSFLSATNYPLLKHEQLPLKWLKTNPGFPILLIESSEIERDWIYHPYDQTKNHYQLRQDRPARDQKLLFVLEENATLDDIKRFSDTYPGKSSFIFRDQENFEILKNKEFKIFNSYLFCYQSSWRPDLIIFQNPSYSKCIRPQIVHAIHLGGIIKTEYWNKTATNKNSLWYGTWELFDGK